MVSLYFISLQWIGLTKTGEVSFVILQGSHLNFVKILMYSCISVVLMLFFDIMHFDYFWSYGVSIHRLFSIHLVCLYIYIMLCYVMVFRIMFSSCIESIINLYINFHTLIICLV